MVIKADKVFGFIHPNREKVDVRKPNGDLAFTATLDQVMTLCKANAVIGEVQERKAWLRYLMIIVPEIRARKLAGLATGSRPIQKLPRAEDSKTSYLEGATHLLHFKHCATFDPRIRNIQPDQLHADQLSACA